MDPSLHVFILAGQSNMSGRGELLPEDQLPQDRILVLDKQGHFVPAQEPLHYIEPERTGTGPGMAFARCLLPHLPDGDKIGLVPCAVGGSAIQQWLADEEYRGVQLYTHLIRSVKQASAYGQLKSLLWHQGESNTYGGRYEGYKALLAAFFSRLRTEIGQPDLPIIAAELGEFLDPAIYPMARQLNHDLHELTHELNGFHLVPSNGLGCLEDRLHFNRDGMIGMGKRMCRAYSAIISNL